MANKMHTLGGLKQGVTPSTEVPPVALLLAVGMAAGHLEKGIAQESLAALSSKKAHLIPGKASLPEQGQPQTPVAQ